MTDSPPVNTGVARWKCTSYCRCESRKGHFERNDDGAWVIYADHAAEIDRLQTGQRSK